MTQSSAAQALLIVILAGTVSGCSLLKQLPASRLSPRDVYARSLERSGLKTSAIARAWTAAGQPNSRDSVIIIPPFQERGFFSASETACRKFGIDLTRGQRLSVTVSAKGTGKLFVDLLEEADGTWKTLVSTDSSGIFRFVCSRSAHCVLRLQPELLADVSYGLNLALLPALINPVQGATNKSIQGYYDDWRTVNGKKVKHEGLDIFAKKGTLVIAPADGTVSRVTTNSLGGNVVWMQDPALGYSYYFAHLDKQIAKPGPIREGGALGTVGNTGNAKDTPSHLHFGIFKNGSVDPLPFLVAVPLPGLFLADTALRMMAVRVGIKSTRLLQTPSAKAAVIRILRKDEYLLVVATSAAFDHVITADYAEGFVDHGAVLPASRGNAVMLTKPTTLFLRPASESLVKGEFTGRAEVLASFHNFRFVRTPNRSVGWVDLRDLSAIR